MLESSHVKWYTDNQAAVKIVDVGSMNPDLHKLAVKIFGACIRSKIKLEVRWIPRSENEKADFISRLIDVDDWQLTESFFATLGVWRPHSFDCMATAPILLLCKVRFWMMVAVRSCTAETQILFWDRNLLMGKLQAPGLIFAQERKIFRR